MRMDLTPAFIFSWICRLISTDLPVPMIAFKAEVGASGIGDTYLAVSMMVSSSVVNCNISSTAAMAATLGLSSGNARAMYRLLLS